MPALSPATLAMPFFLSFKQNPKPAEFSPTQTVVHNADELVNVRISFLSKMASISPATVSFSAEWSRTVQETLAESKTEGGSSG